MPRSSSVHRQAHSRLLPFEVHVAVRKRDDGENIHCLPEEALREEGRRLQPVRGGLHRAVMLPVLEDSIKVVTRQPWMKHQKFKRSMFVQQSESK